jgi:hypothetical protein
MSSSSEIEKLVSKLLKEKLDKLVPILRKEITEQVLASLKKEEVPKVKGGKVKTPKTPVIESEEELLVVSDSSPPRSIEKCSFDFDKMKYADLMKFVKEKGGKDFKCSHGKKATLVELRECAKKLVKDTPIQKEKSEKIKPKQKEFKISYDETYKVYTDENKKYIFYTSDGDAEVIGKLNKNQKLKNHFVPLTKKDVDEIKKIGLKLYHVETLNRDEPLSKEELIALIEKINSDESSDELVESSSSSEESSSSSEEEKEESSSTPEDDDLEEDEEEKDSLVPEKDNVENLEEVFSRLLSKEEVKKPKINPPQNEKKTEEDSLEEDSSSSESEEEVVISKSDFEKFMKYQNTPRSSSTFEYDSIIGITKKQFSEIIRNYSKYEKQFLEKSNSKTEEKKTSKNQKSRKLEKRDDDDDF